VDSRPKMMMIVIMGLECKRETIFSGREDGK
jgi:hypothetical protein